MMKSQLVTDPKLLRLLAESAAHVDAMTQEERDEMHRQQSESYVRGEMGWPKPRYHFEGGAKVYESYADYCDD